jgi:hypothetical protein
MESLETDVSSKNILQIVNKAIESSIQLRAKIKQYLYTLKITTDNFRDVSFIISYISKSIILYIIDKKDTLTHLMTNSIASYSYEFFKQWFTSFLLFYDEYNDRNKKIYQDLLQNWSNQFIKLHEIFMKILTDMDFLINSLEHKQYQSIFIQHMIILCFRHGNIILKVN